MKGKRDAVIVSAVRTPIGKFMGTLSTSPAPRLGAVAAKDAVKRANELAAMGRIRGALAFWAG